VSFPILDMRNPGAHDDLLTEAERLLHNVLTSMSTRVDQQRRFMEKNFHDDPVLTEEYRQRVASVFAASAEATLLKGLRNYIAHTQLPVAQSRQTIRSESIEITFILPGEPLLIWDGWKSSVRAWIAAQGEAVAIVEVVDVYARLAAFQREHERYTCEYERVFGK
jgi:hypothetical protein